MRGAAVARARRVGVDGTRRVRVRPAFVARAAISVRSRDADRRATGRPASRPPSSTAIASRADSRSSCGISTRDHKCLRMICSSGCEKSEEDREGRWKAGRPAGRARGGQHDDDCGRHGHATRPGEAHRVADADGHDSPRKTHRGRSPAIKDFVPLASLDDIVFGGWDIFDDNCYEAAKTAGVLERQLLEQIKPELEAITPMPGGLRSAVCEAARRPERQEGQEQAGSRRAAPRRHPEVQGRTTASVAW